MDFDVDLDGFDTAIEELKERERNLGQSGPWMVGMF